MKVILANAFSLNMLPDTFGNVSITRSDVAQVRYVLSLDRLTGSNFVSAIGHADTATLLAERLGLTQADLRPDGPADGPWPRPTVKMADGDILAVGQYVGPRLPEGATSLPDGARIDWFLVTLS